MSQPRDPTSLRPLPRHPRRRSTGSRRPPSPPIRRGRGQHVDRHLKRDPTGRSQPSPRALASPRRPPPRRLPAHRTRAPPPAAQPDDLDRREEAHNRSMQTGRGTSHSTPPGPDRGTPTSPPWTPAEANLSSPPSTRTPSCMARGRRTTMPNSRPGHSSADAIHSTEHSQPTRPGTRTPSRVTGAAPNGEGRTLGNPPNGPLGTRPSRSASSSAAAAGPLQTPKGLLQSSTPARARPCGRPRREQLQGWNPRRDLAARCQRPAHPPPGAPPNRSPLREVASLLAGWLWFLLISGTSSKPTPGAHHKPPKRRRRPGRRRHVRPRALPMGRRRWPTLKRPRRRTRSQGARAFRWQLPQPRQIRMRRRLRARLHRRAAPRDATSAAGPSRQPPNRRPWRNHKTGPSRIPPNGRARRRARARTPHRRPPQPGTKEGQAASPPFGTASHER